MNSSDSRVSYLYSEVSNHNNEMRIAAISQISGACQGSVGLLYRLRLTRACRVGRRLMATAATIFLRSPIFPSKRNSLNARSTRICLIQALPLPSAPLSKMRRSTDADTTSVSNRAHPSASKTRVRWRAPEFNFENHRQRHRIREGVSV